ncbi:MAG: GNAT family N-acetyltransferase [Candidatus Bathyarchaeia archaeon]
MLTFYLALENDEIIGFAQTVQKDANTSELDRIIVFPRYTRRGIGTQLLKQAIADQEQKGINNVIVDIGKEEIQARGFYEKDGFKQTEEATIEAPVGQKNNSSYLPASFGAWVILELPLAAAMQRNS